MERLNSLDDFTKLRDMIIASQVKDMPVIVFPAGTCGQASGINDLIRVTRAQGCAQIFTYVSSQNVF